MRTQLNIRLEPQELDALKRAAAADSRSVSDFVRDRLRPHIGMTTLSQQQGIETQNDVLETVERLERRLAELEELAQRSY